MLNLLDEIGDTDFRKTQFYRDILQEGEGRGEIKGELKLICRYLNRLESGAAEKYKTQLRSLSRAQLNELIDDLYDFENLAAFEYWLASNC